jgi:murein DD-endopeptidase MepM/ murein hydrolase activator NlpD
MARRLLLCLLCTLVLASPAAGGDIHRQKRVLDERISTLHDKMSRAKAKEGVLTQQISIVNAKIRAMQSDVVSAQSRLNQLERVLEVHQRRLDDLNTLFKLQSQKLALIRRSYFAALARLQRRLIQAYETPGVSAVDVMLSSTSMSNLINDVEYLQRIGTQDKHISDELHKARTEMHRVREETRTVKDRAARETAVVRDQAAQQHAVTRQLISNQQQLAVARSSKRETLHSIKVNEQVFAREAAILQSQSASLGARIRAAEARAGGTPRSTGATGTSSSGLIWPVSGPISSPFGPRCLPNGDCAFHPGVDIAVGSGTPIKAAASGRVIYAGWMEGYGNFVVIDHGNQLATAYAHQTSIAVSNGASVSQGQVIGYSGCTGYCFGPHLHFEVRVNGSPVDPLRYL